MDLISVVIMFLCMLCSTGRNLFSKSVSKDPFGHKGFFQAQAIIFTTGAIVLLLLSLDNLADVTLPATLHAIAYGVVLLTAQWFYSASLNRGNLSVCTIIYSFGFIIPTTCGFIFWNEPITLFKILGILVVIPVVILAGKENSVTDSGQKKKKGFMLPLIVATIASGNLAVVQKIFQNSSYAGENSVFLLTAFIVGAVASTCGSLICSRQKEKSANRKVFAVGAGICYGFFCMTSAILLERVDSSVLFPLINICMILFSMGLSVVFFKEKITRRKLLIVALGIVGIIMINLK